MDLIPSEMIGSLPRMSKQNISYLISRQINIGAHIVCDGEQTKPSFLTYPLDESQLLKDGDGGVIIPFADGHIRTLPVFDTKTKPFRYKRFADEYIYATKKYTDLPIKQSIISCSALSLIYPSEEDPLYTRDQFLIDLKDEFEKDIRKCLQANVTRVQIDMTELRLSIKLDPTLNLLKTFIQMNNDVLNRFTFEERQKLGVHVCPGGDHNSTHSLDVDYQLLLPELFHLNVTNFYLAYSTEPNKKDLLYTIKMYLQPHQRVFLGVINVLTNTIETPEEVYGLVMQALEIIPFNQLGTTDDCGFAPFSDDTYSKLDLVFEKIRARIDGTRLAEDFLRK